MPDWLLIPIGLIVLVVSAEVLIRGAVNLALALGISKLMVGLTIVAFGTSAPELVVAIVDVFRDDAALQQAGGSRGGIALGTVFGSNIANIGLILGVTALLTPIPVVGASLRLELTFLGLLTGMLFLPLALDNMFSRLVGGLLLGTLLLFTAVLIYRERRGRRAMAKPRPEDDGQDKGRGVWISLGMVIVGVLALRTGAVWLVDGCSGVAKSWGITESMISATVVAIGSSLPELVTAVLSARRGHPELVFGNIVGSNIFNIGMVVGSTALLQPIGLEWAEHGVRMLVGVTMTVAIAWLILGPRRVGRLAGLVLLTGYVAYIGYEVSRVTV